MGLSDAQKAVADALRLITNRATEILGILSERVQRSEVLRIPKSCPNELGIFECDHGIKLGPSERTETVLWIRESERKRLRITDDTVQKYHVPVKTPRGPKIYGIQPWMLLSCERLFRSHVETVRAYIDGLPSDWKPLRVPKGLGSEDFDRQIALTREFVDGILSVAVKLSDKFLVNLRRQRCGTLDGAFFSPSNWVWEPEQSQLEAAATAREGGRSTRRLPGVGMRWQEANVQIQKYLEQHAKDHTVTVGELVSEIPCSQGTVSKCPAWQAYMKVRKAARQPSAVGMTDKILTRKDTATEDSDRDDEIDKSDNTKELERLIVESNKENSLDPSPLDENARPRKFTPRRKP